MGRGTAEEVQALKSHIVLMSTRLFAAHGFGATSISDIAKASGVSKALVLYHFGSKGGLRERVMGDLSVAFGHVFPRVQEVAAEEGDVLRAVFVEVVEVFRKYPDLARLLMREIMSETPTPGQPLKSRALPVLASLENLLRDALGFKVPDDLDVRAALVFFGLAMVSVVAVFPVDGERLSDDDADLGARLLRQGFRSLGLTFDHESAAAL